MKLTTSSWPEFWTGTVTFFDHLIHDWTPLWNILIIIVSTVVIRLVLLFVLRRVIARIVRGVKGKNNVTDTTQLLTSPLAEARVLQRTRTMGTVLSNVITWVLLILAALGVLQQVGFPSGTLTISATVLGAALGIGAQSLVKDFLTGVFMVFEDQLGVGDIVDLGTVQGTVETVGLRVTSVRSLDGTLWYVRNGEILKVGNKSHGWGRAIIEVPISNDADFETVESVMLAAAKDMLKERSWATRVSGSPELWGIDAMQGSTLVLKLAIKTKPSQQFQVSRELRARTMRFFEKYDIALAPDQTIYNLTPADDAARVHALGTAAPSPSNTDAGADADADKIVDIPTESDSPSTQKDQKL